MISRIVAYLVNKIFLIIPVYIFYEYVYVRSGIYRQHEYSGGNGLSGLFVLEAMIGILCLPYSGIVSSGILDYGIQISLSWLIVPLIIISGFIIIDTIVSVILKGDIGKKILRLKVCTKKGEELTGGKYLLRNIIKYFSLMFFPIILIYPLFNKGRDTLHDKILGTKVCIREKK